MHCVHTVSGVEMKLWIGPKGELDKELFACFGGCYYLSQAHSVRLDLFERTCVNNVWSCWLSVGIRVSIAVDLAFALQELQGKQFFMEYKWVCVLYKSVALQRYKKS